MCNKDVIKRKALEKLDVLVREAINYNRDTKAPIEVVNITPPTETYFSFDEFHEIERNIDTINGSIEGLRRYCRDRDIKI
jgi:hypothetical protein